MNPFESKKEISVGLFFRTAWRFRNHCLLLALAVILAVNLGLGLKSKYYTASATFMNISDEKGGSNLFQVVGLVKSINEGFFKFMAIMRSRTFQEQVVQDLGPEFFAPRKGWKGPPEALKNYALSQLSQSLNLRINPEQSNVLNISVTHWDPKKAPVVVNQVLVDLQKYISKNSLTQAKRLRNYIEENIIETKAAVFETAEAMANFYKKNPVNPQKAQIENPLRKEALKLSSLSLEEFASDPLLKDTVGQFSDKRKELILRLEAIKEIPEQSYFDYLKEEYQILKEINFTLRQQYESAKLDAIKQEPAFQILDLAQGSSYAGLGKKKIFQMSAVIALLVVSFYVLLRCFYTSLTPRAVFNSLSFGAESARSAP